MKDKLIDKLERVNYPLIMFNIFFITIVFGADLKLALLAFILVCLLDTVVELIKGNRRNVIWNSLCICFLIVLGIIFI